MLEKETVNIWKQLHVFYSPGGGITVELSLPEPGRLLKGAQTFDEKVTQL